MQEMPLDTAMIPRVAQALGQSPLFKALNQQVLEQVASRGKLLQVAAEETLVEEGAPSDAFFVVLAGELAVYVNAIELVTMRPADTVGEMGLLLKQPRTASVKAKAASVLLRFDEESFHVMYERVPGFGLAVSRALAQRVAASSQQIQMPAIDDVEPDAEVMGMLPIELMQRHRVIPLKQEEHRLVLGCVEDVRPQVMSAVREQLPGMEISPVRVTLSTFERLMSGHGGVQGWQKPIGVDDEPMTGLAAGDELTSSQEGAPVGTTPPTSTVSTSPRLDALLRRMVAEGCSDVHISGGQRPRWRIDGEVKEIADTAVLGPTEVYDLLRPVMEERSIKAFEADNDADFAHAIPGVARFRVNLFKDKGGVGAVLRQIPAKILTFEQLNLPPVVQRMCENPKGLVLVTGPTGSGKSTTLAAMIDFINKSRASHIITLEDPIEFVHKSLKCLVNQREVGSHTKSFHRALKAALREDPDIVLVGEMRDLETISLALETANTGHLVFGTLHTSTAISTVDRIIDVYPAEQQPQVRAVLADTIKGIVAQALCRRIGGGRVAALETLVVSFAIANLIREGKTHQMVSAMSTSKAQGNSLLNEALGDLVNKNVVEFSEALSKAADKADLARRCGKPLPAELQPK